MAAPTSHRESYYHSIHSGLLNNEQIYAALLTSHTGFGKYMHDPCIKRTQKQKVIDSTFPEFKERVAERLETYFAKKD